MSRVVVTGLGLVTALGSGVEKSWSGFLNGVDAASEVTLFDTSLYKTHYACEIKDFVDETGFGRDKQDNYVNKFAHAAVKEALNDSGLQNSHAYDRDRFGIALGSLAAEIVPFERLLKSDLSKKTNGFDANVASCYPPNSITNYLSEVFDLTGPSMVSLNACSSGNHAISWAYDMISCGNADVMVVGGSETINITEYTHFHNVKALAPEKCTPFDKNRSGLLIGEGAGILIIESLDFALKRNADIYAELKGVGLSCDGFHMTAPHPEGAGAISAMKEALYTANLSVDEIDYISAHGTGTPLNDKSESLAIHTIFKERTKEIPCSSVKSMIGHPMGAASAIESVVSCLAIRNSVVPPTINYTTMDPECAIDCVPNTAREVKVRNVINNSFAFGGNNAVLIFGEM